MAFVATLLRVYVRLFIVRSFGSDDAWMVGALVCYLVVIPCSSVLICSVVDAHHVCDMCHCWGSLWHREILR